MNAICFRSNAASSSSSSSDSFTRSASNTVTTTLHLKKRKLEVASSETTSSKIGVGKGKVQQLKKGSQQRKEEDAMLETAVNKEGDSEGTSATAKRRRKTLKCESSDDVTKAAEADSTQKPSTVVLPQKKRALPSTSAGSAGTSPVRSPARKTAKAAASSSATTTDEPVDDETLIRETEAALKSLSGSWPGPRGSFYNRGITEHEDRFESPTFENLFEEKKVNNKMSPSSSSSSSSGCSESSSCSLKDVITLRGQQPDSKSSRSESRASSGVSANASGSGNAQGKQQSDAGGKASASNTTKSHSKTKSQDRDVSQQQVFQEGNELENLLKIENECATIQSQVGSSGPNAHLLDTRRSIESKNMKDKNASTSSVNSSSEAILSSNRTMEYATTSRYEPDFNELVDDSSNELEIDMSDPSGDKEEDDDSDRTNKNEDRLKRKEESLSLSESRKDPSSSDIQSSSFHDRQPMFVPSSQQQQQRAFQPNKSTCAIGTSTLLSPTGHPSPPPTAPPSSSSSSSSPSSSVSFSATSAFRAINSSQSSKDSSSSSRLPSTSTTNIDLQTSVGTAIPPIGPYPASATFVGYPGSVGLQGPGTETGSTPQHSVTSLDEKHTAAAVCLLQLKTNTKEECDKGQEAEPTTKEDVESSRFLFPVLSFIWEEHFRYPFSD
ncbi:hypothetical protein C0J52_07400 [Blattella germanica]|nr:hypothetical protein C0J52_07400 [Blattella germanica]